MAHKALQTSKNLTVASTFCLLSCAGFLQDPEFLRSLYLFQVCSFFSLIIFPPISPSLNFQILGKFSGTILPTLLLFSFLLLRSYLHVFIMHM